MNKFKIRFIDVFYWVAFIGTDIFIYLFFGILQMDYDDHYDSSKREYWSLGSMNKKQLLFYFLLQLWNIINIIGLIYIGRKIFKRIKNST